jgi:hypothetical protein
MTGNSYLFFYSSQFELQTARQEISETPKQLAKLEVTNKRLASDISYHNVQMEVLKMEKEVVETKLIETLATVSKLRGEIKSHQCPTVREASPDIDIDQSILYSDQDTSFAQDQARLLAIRLEEKDNELEVMANGRLVYEQEIGQLTVRSLI